MNKFTNSILHTLSIGARVTLTNGTSFRLNVDGDIIYENKEDKKIVSKGQVGEILDSIKFWETESGRYIDMEYMTTDHIVNTIRHQKRKIETFRNIHDKNRIKGYIDDLQVILRERNINTILEKEDYGLYNLNK